MSREMPQKLANGMGMGKSLGDAQLQVPTFKACAPVNSLSCLTIMFAMLVLSASNMDGVTCFRWTNRVAYSDPVPDFTRGRPLTRLWNI